MNDIRGHYKYKFVKEVNQEKVLLLIKKEKKSEYLTLIVCDLPQDKIPNEPTELKYQGKRNIKASKAKDIYKLSKHCLKLTEEEKNYWYPRPE